MREKILACLGNFPEKVDPCVCVLSETDKGAYLRRLIEYNVEADERIRAYLLVPKALRKKNPAVLAIHQHAGKWALGKREVVGLDGDPMHCYGLELVRRGFVVLAPDLLCFEERIPSPFADTPESLSQYERFAFLHYIEHGACLQTKYLHDLSAAVDVLSGFDFVDAENIGAIGHSLGGQETLWITWYDQRIKAGVSSCGTGTVKSVFNANIIHNYALYVPGMGEVCDIDELAAEIAPRGIFLTNGQQDLAHFPLDGVEAIEARCTGNPGFCALRFDGAHAFPDAVKAQAYAWLEEKLGMMERNHDYDL